MKQVQASDEPLPHFNPKMEASACYLTSNGELLLLEQAPSKKDAGRWGIPAGKLEPGETPLQAVQRELMEETHLSFPSSQLSYLTTLWIRIPNLDYLYHMFAIDLPQKPKVHLSSEHTAYQWIPLPKLLTLPLRIGAEEALPLYLKYKDHPLKKQFRFAHALPSQRSLIHQWLAQPHIQKWIHGQGLQNTLHGLEAFFQGTSDTTYWIGYLRETPVSFLITSPKGNDATTLDLFLCDLNYLGKGLAVPMIRTFLLTHFSHLARVLIDPEATNLRAIHVYEQVGFKIIHEFIAPWHPVPHYQMELSMRDLAEEGR